MTDPTGVHINLADLPDDPAELADAAVDFPRLEDDSPASCPSSIGELVEYINMEIEGLGEISTSNLVFLRTAQVGERRYWIWRFPEPDGQMGYATVSLDPDGQTTQGYDSDRYGLSAEQYLLGDYHGFF